MLYMFDANSFGLFSVHISSTSYLRFNCMGMIFETLLQKGLTKNFNHLSDVLSFIIYSQLIKRVKCFKHQQNKLKG